MTTAQIIADIERQTMTAAQITEWAYNCLTADSDGLPIPMGNARRQAEQIAEHFRLPLTHGLLDGRDEVSDLVSRISGHGAPLWQLTKSPYRGWYRPAA